MQDAIFHGAEPFDRIYEQNDQVHSFDKTANISLPGRLKSYPLIENSNSNSKFLFILDYKHWAHTLNSHSHHNQASRRNTQNKHRHTSGHTKSFIPYSNQHTNHKHITYINIHKLYIYICTCIEDFAQIKTYLPLIYEPAKMLIL